MHKLILLFFLLSSLNASLTITDDEKKYANFPIEYLYDENSSLGIQDIQNINFTKKINSQFTLGYRLGNAWFKINIMNKSQKEDFILYFTEVTWYKLNLYTKTDNIYSQTKSGLSIPLKKQTIKDNAPAFNIHVPKDTNITIYLQASTISGHMGEFQVFSVDEFYRPTRITISEMYAIFAAVLFGLVILNIYNLIITKEIIYVYYIAYVTSFIIFSSMHSGLYLSFGFSGWNEGLHTVGSLVTYFLLLFSKEFLNLKVHFPKIEKLFRIFGIIFLLLALLITINIPYTSFILNIIASLFFTILLVVTIKIWLKGVINAKYYLLALMIFLPSMGLMTMNYNAMLPNTDITRYSFLVGSFIEIVFFTLILTNKYTDANKDKILAQKSLLNEQCKNEQNLISEIDKQTKHLQTANAQLLEQTIELKETKELLTIEAQTDMLSGLYNRRYFFEASQKTFYAAVRYNKELSVLMLDIDDFKHVNDTYGHIFGDRVIRTISNILKKLTRDSDILARYGGEEFVLLLPETDVKKAYILSERIREEIEQKDITLDNDDIFHITVSIGLTQLNKIEDVDIEHTITRADKALYVSKENGKNMISTI